MTVDPHAIRPLALALIRRDGEILVERGRDEVKGETFYRLLGGAIEFGERGAEAVRRELREELGVEVDVDQLVATIENVFTWEGQPGHEIVLVYECSPGTTLPAGAWDADEPTPNGVVTHELFWKRPADFGPAGERLYPEELLSLLAAETA